MWPLDTKNKERRDTNSAESIHIILKYRKNAGTIMNSAEELGARIVTATDEIRFMTVISRILELTCTINARPAPSLYVVILINFIDDYRCLTFCTYFLVFWYDKKNKQVSSLCKCPSFLVFCVVASVVRCLV